MSFAPSYGTTTRGSPTSRPSSTLKTPIEPLHVFHAQMQPSATPLSASVTAIERPSGDHSGMMGTALGGDVPARYA